MFHDSLNLSGKSEFLSLDTVLGFNGLIEKKLIWNPDFKIHDKRSKQFVNILNIWTQEYESDISILHQVISAELCLITWQTSSPN